MAISPSKLTSQHLEDILVHETEYPPEYRLGRERLEQKLRNLDESGCSMAWIIHDGEQCVAYIMVYPQFSRLQKSERERVIYVDDVFVKKGYEVCLFRLIQLFTQEATRLGMRDYPIEGVCRVGAYRAFASHDRLLRRLGWELAQKSEYWDSTVNEEMCWLRWEPLYEEDAVPVTEDKINIGSEEADDMRAPAEKLVTLSESKRYEYRPQVVPDHMLEEVDEFDALNKVMMGIDEYADMFRVCIGPVIEKKPPPDVFGIQEFLGIKKPYKKKTLRERLQLERVPHED